MSQGNRSIDRLIFVFAANSGTVSAFIDSAKKLLHIKGCTLCAITHGLAGEKAEWKTCKDEIGVPVEYVHADEISQELREEIGEQLPCVVAGSGDERVLLLGPDVLDRCKGSIPDLKGRIMTYASMKGLRLPRTV